MCCLLVKELAEQGLKTNINKLIDSMAEVKRVLVLVGDLGKPTKHFSFTEGDDLAEQVLSIYNLKEKYI
jgi:nickel-dependent lactate racemase